MRAGQATHIPFFPSPTVTLWAQALMLSEDSREVYLAMVNWRFLALCFWMLDSKVPAIFFLFLLSHKLV